MIAIYGLSAALVSEHSDSFNYDILAFTKVHDLGFISYVIRESAVMNLNVISLYELKYYEFRRNLTGLA